MKQTVQYFSKKVSTKECFEPARKGTHTTESQEIKVRRGIILSMLEEMDINRAIGPDDVFDHILNESRLQLRVSITDVMSCLLTTRRVPKKMKKS